MSKRKEYEDQERIWSPTGNPSVIALDRSRELFPSEGGYIGVLAEVKDSEDNIISLVAL